MRLLLFPLLFLPPADQTSAQVPEPPMITRLRADVRAHPDSFEVVLALGRALGRMASERQDEWPLRVEAKELLDRAFRLRPDDPRPFMELGAVLRKEGARGDARRVLQRAERIAARAAEDLSAADRAELHFQLALIAEVGWEDARNTGFVPSNFVSGSCSNLMQQRTPGAANQMGVVRSDGPGAGLSMGLGRGDGGGIGQIIALNFACPLAYEEIMSRFESTEDAGDDDYASMVYHLREAMAHAPHRSDIAIRLLRHLADRQAWPEFLEVAEPLGRRLGENPEVLLYVGLGYYETGRLERADSVFTLVLRLASDALRRDLLRPEQLLRRQDSTVFVELHQRQQEGLADIFWRARDPLFLTPQNERLAEHMIRMAYVEVAFSSPTTGRRGRHSDRGTAWLRYGRPLRIRTLMPTGGRVEFWDYGPDSPDLVFERMITYRGARHHELSDGYVRYAREYTPELPDREVPRILGTIPFQAAAFRADTGGVLEVYAAVPAGLLREASGLAAVELGTYLMDGDFWEPRGAHHTRLNAGVDRLDHDVRFPVGAGRMAISLEVLSGNLALRTRERLTVPAFGDTLGISDLLLVERFANDPGVARTREDLAPVVSRTLRFPAGGTVGVLWEIYGLATDSGGTARYRVTAEVTDERHRGVVMRTLRGLVGVDDEQVRVTWEASRVPREDGTVVEYLRLELSDAPAGMYRVLITVQDLATGRTQVAHRLFRLSGP